MKNITPELRGLHSPDVEDLSAFRPSEGVAFSILVQAVFGPAGAEGEESFDIVVCSPEWLAEELTRHAAITGRHLMIVKSFDLEAFRRHLVEIASRCQGATWVDVATKLSTIGRWEFEDYDASPRGLPYFARLRK